MRISISLPSILFTVIAAGALSGSAVLPVATKQVRFQDLPAAVQRTVNAQAGASGIASIDQQTRTGVPMYEVRLNRPGENKLIYISETGSVIDLPNVISSKPAQDSSRKATFNELPIAVQNTVRGQAGTAAIEDIDVVTENGRTNYDVAFKREGQTVELWVDPQGRILRGGQTMLPPQTRANLSAASKVTLQELPAAAQRTLRTYAQGAQIEDIDKGTLQGRTVYEAAFKHNGQNIELRVADDGTLIRDDFNDRYLTEIGQTPGGATGTHGTIASSEDWASAPVRVPLSAATKVNYRDLPSAVRKTLHTYTGDTRIEDVDKGTLGGQTVYEAAFKYQGQNTELRVADDGTLVKDDANQRFLTQFSHQSPANVGTAPSWQALTGGRSSTELVNPATVDFERLPPSVQNAFRAQAGASAIENIKRGTLDGVNVYEATINRGGRNVKVHVKQDGAVLR